MHEIFSDRYRIRRDAFAFDAYVERVYEKFLVSVITIQPMDWLIVVVVVLLNWGRLVLDIHWHYACAEEDTDCFEANDLRIFTLTGR